MLLIDRCSTAIRFVVVSTVAVAFVCLPGCATVTVEKVNRDNPVRSFERKSGPAEPFQHHVSCEPLTADLQGVCLIEVEGTCSSATVQVVDRTVEIRRSTSTLAKVFEYLPAGALMAAGAGVTADAHNVPASDDPTRTNPVGRKGAYAIGISLAAVGTGLLALAITDSARARDSEDHVGEIEIPGAPRSFLCDRRPLRTMQLKGRAGAGEIDVGSTGADGRIRIDIAKLVPADLVLGRTAARSLTLLLGSKPIGEMPLDLYRKGLCDARLQEAIAAGPLDQKLRFFADCPDAAVLLGQRQDLGDLASAALKGVAVRCQGKKDDESLAACEDSVGNVATSVPSPEAEALRANLSGRREALAEHARVLEERRARAEELREERRARAEQARAEAWTRNHVAHAKQAALSELMESLRSPGTARVLSTRIIESEGTEYQVHIVVDAQNGFGVFIRSGYCISVELVKENPKRYFPRGMVECGVRAGD